MHSRTVTLFDEHMKAASVKEIKNELETIPSGQLLDICMRLAKFKKENKELISYLLFEEQDEQQYIVSVKEEIDLAFEEMNTSNVYFAKKTIRRAVRISGKYIKYSSQKTTEAELLLYICKKLQESSLDITKSTVLSNINRSLLKKAAAAIGTMHEDLQYEFLRDLKQLGG